MQIYIDGQFYDREDAKVSVFDHGLLYGDGIFEGIRVYNRRIFEFDDHIDRLYDSAKAIAMRIPLDRDSLMQATLETVRRNQLAEGYIRLVVTRGVGDLGLNPIKCPVATIFIIAATIQLYPEDFYTNGLRVMTCSTRRNIPEAINPAVKSLNYLNNVLAAVELQGTDCQEGLMLNADGYVAECTADNFFMVRGGKLCTPSLSVGALRGITRKVILRLAAEAGLEVEEGLYTLYDVYTADEAFLTGTGAEVAPVVVVDRRPIGSGHPGVVTQNLIQRFREYTQVAGTPVYPDVPQNV
jgi:branched-chain amino acid aminotransferase